MEELVLPKPDLQKLMAVMPNFEDFEDLIIRRLECGGRGTVSRGGVMMLTLVTQDCPRLSVIAFVSKLLCFQPHHCQLDGNPEIGNSGYINHRNFPPSHYLGAIV